MGEAGTGTIRFSEYISILLEKNFVLKKVNIKSNRLFVDNSLPKLRKVPISEMSL